MKCPQCQTDISDDSRFCSKCGTPISAEERIVFSQTRTILRPIEERAPGTLLGGRAAAALSHPNICTIYEIHDEGEKPFIAMEYIEGQSLRARLAKGPLS